MQPNKENIQKWVDALLSGKYLQTKEILHDEYGYCCWGVACEIAMQNGVPLQKQICPLNRSGIITKYNEQSSCPPDSVIEWLGIPRSESQAIIDKYIHLNDQDGYSFNHIAKRIALQFLAQ